MKKFLIILSSLLLMSSCHPGKDAKNDLAQFTQRIESRSDKWNQADWDDAAQKYDEICQTIAKYEYSEQETIEIDSLKSICAKQFLSQYPYLRELLK